MTAKVQKLRTVRYAQIQWRDKAGKEFAEYQASCLAFANGQKVPFTGTATDHFSPDHKSIEGNFKAGHLHGEETWWYRSGHKYSLVTYKLGVRHGPHRVWYEDGRLQIEVVYKEGRRHGVHTVHHENGCKRSEAAFKADQLHGAYTTWFEDGSKRSERTFKQGVEVRRREWDAKGQQKILNNWKPNGTARHTR